MRLEVDNSPKFSEGETPAAQRWVHKASMCSHRLRSDSDWVKFCSSDSCATISMSSGERPNSFANCGHRAPVFKAISFRFNSGCDFLADSSSEIDTSEKCQHTAELCSLTKVNFANIIFVSLQILYVRGETQLFCLQIKFTKLFNTILLIF